jgi:hypothetical protein
MLFMMRVLLKRIHNKLLGTTGGLVQGLALKILKSIEKFGEMTLKDLGEIIPSKFNDHRDFYILASLKSNGFIDDDLLIDENIDPNSNKEQLLARTYFASNTANDKAEYMGTTYSIIGGSSLYDKIFALTGKGNLYLSEQRMKRKDRIITLASGIVVGILVAVVSAYFKGKVNGST